MSGSRRFIRVGSTGALQAGMEPGDLVISQGSFRNDGTTDAYVPKGYPAVPDLEITLELERVARERAPAHSLGVHVGLNVTDDAFYAESPEWTTPDVGPRAAQRRDGVVGDVRRRAAARPPGRDDLRGLEQSRGRHERVRRDPPTSGWPSAGVPASRSPSRPRSGSRCRSRSAAAAGSGTSSRRGARGPEPAHAPRGLGPARRPPPSWLARPASRRRPAAGTGRCAWGPRRT